MARTNTLGNFLTDVADAIRQKTGSQDTINASNFDTAIANIPSGGGLNWSAIGYSEQPSVFTNAYNYAKNIYDNWDATQTSLNQKFKDDKDLIIMPNVNTENSTDFSSMFNGCNGLSIMAPINTSNGTNFSSMFNGCVGLTSIPELDLSKATNISSMLSSATGLTTIGGFKNLGQAYSTSRASNYTNYKLNINSNNLTHDSLMNIINDLYDIATKGCNPQAVIFGSTNLAKLSAAEIAIATAKGWNVS